MARKRINHVLTCSREGVITYHETMERVAKIRRKTEFFKLYNELNGDIELIKYSMSIKETITIYKQTKTQRS